MSAITERKDGISGSRSKWKDAYSDSKRTSIPNLGVVGTSTFTPTTKIQNVVASVTLGQDIDLDEIVATIPDIEYHPEQFPGLVYRLKKPKTATLIFNTGKMVCTDAKSVKESTRAVHRIVKNLNEAGIKITGKPKITIQNIVASGDIGVNIDLEKAILVLENSMYEPEQFPVLIYRMKNPKTVILVFGSGKVVITGAKLEEQVPEAAMKVRDRLLELDLVRMDDMSTTSNHR